MQINCCGKKRALYNSFSLNCFHIFKRMAAATNAVLDEFITSLQARAAALPRRAYHDDGSTIVVNSSSDEEGDHDMLAKEVAAATTKKHNLPDCSSCGTFHHDANAMCDFQYDVAADMDLIDSISQEPFLDPVNLPCGHTFSHLSIKHAAANKHSKCPQCRHPFSLHDFRSNFTVKAMTDKLKVTCPHQGVCGVKTTFERSNLKQHLLHCAGMTLPCSYGCGLAVLQKDQVMHEQTCPSANSLVPCGNCMFYVIHKHKINHKCGKGLFILPLHKNSPFDVVFDGNYVKRISVDGSFFTYQSEHYSGKHGIGRGVVQFKIDPLVPVLSLAFITNFGMSSNMFFASLHINNAIIIWSLSSKRALTQITLQTKLKSIRSSPTRDSLILCTSDDKIITLDVTPFLNEGNAAKSKKREHEED